MKLIKKMMIFTAICASATINIGCSTTIEDVDAGMINRLDTDFDANDIQTTAEKMIESILVFPPVVDLTKDGKKPVMTISRFTNSTSQHIDTSLITKKIRNALLKANKFSVVDKSMSNIMADEIKYQQNSGMTASDQSKSFGKQIAIGYLLTGSIGEIVTRGGKKTDVYYQISMELQNIESGEIIWADEKQIRKVKTKGTFGL